MAAKTIMIQGTASDVGKSVITAALCRILSDDGYRVAPFKAQNMALNSYVTADGREIGRAQAVQAQAARTPVIMEMNPILLKPSSDQVAQVIVEGRAIGNYTAEEYHEMKIAMVDVVKSSFERLVSDYDVIVIEGAGSPAEINLRDRDIVNMTTAAIADAPVILVADIDRGGMFASIVGTLELINDEDRARIKSVIVNKFRGRRQLLDPGLQMLTDRTGLPVMGVIPFIHDLGIAAEDSVSLGVGDKTRQSGAADIVVIKLPNISNFTDLDALAREPGINLRYAASPDEIRGANAVILPGTKATIKSMAFLRQSGIAALLKELAVGGMPVIGICGGYQLMGEIIADPHGVESPETAEIEGLGLLPVVTTFECEKITRRSRATVSGAGPILGPIAGSVVNGYEIHMGVTKRHAGRPFALFDDGEEDGAVSDNGLQLGTYLHGIFDNDILRRRLIEFLRGCLGLAAGDRGQISDEHLSEASFNRLARVVKDNLDMKLFYSILALEPATVGT